MNYNVYKSFKNFGQKSKFICKSEITKDSLRKMGLENFKVVDVKKIFDEIPLFVIVSTGSSIDPKKKRHTKYVSKYVLYNAVVKGLR